MAKRTKEEALQTRERILDAAVEVFHERGVARPSLTDVARLAGVTRGAVYVHFENKADLFSALSDRIKLPTEAIADVESAAAKADPLGTLRKAWLHLFRQAATDNQWRRILDIIFHRCELVAESGLIQQRINEAHREGTARMTMLLQRAVARGQLPADLDVEAAAIVLHASLIGLLQDWLLRLEPYDLAAEAERFVDALIEMVRIAPHLRKKAPAGSAAGTPD